MASLVYEAGGNFSANISEWSKVFYSQLAYADMGHRNEIQALSFEWIPGRVAKLKPEKPLSFSPEQLVQI